MSIIITKTDLTPSETLYPTEILYPTSSEWSAQFISNLYIGSSVVQKVYIGINLVYPPDLTPPVITVSPVSGTYTSSVVVTLTSNETATIYYTLDNTTPTTSSTIYSSAITITSNCTLKYMAQDQYHNYTSIYSVAYTIVPPNLYPSDILYPSDTLYPNA